MFDIAIIGAGPAGATLARLIGNRYRILLVDKRPFSDVPDRFSAGKCCGGLLAPDAQRMLSELGLGLPRSVLEGPQLFVVRAIDTEQGLERYYQRHYVNMDRQKFDSWLLSMVPPNVEIRTNSHFKSYSSEGDFFQLKFLQDHRTYVEKARILVGADGASSTVRLRMAPGSSSPKRYFAIQEWVEADSSLPYFTSIFDRRISDYYCWTIPKNDYLVIGAALQPREKASEKFSLLKETLRSNGIQFGKRVWREGAFIVRPTKITHVVTGKNRVALLGEAAGFISPSSAEGISYAFRSARALAEALLRGPDGFENCYHKKTGYLRRNIFLKTMKSHVIFSPTLRKAAMNSGFQSVKLYRPQEGT